jgi:hypothetical protein
MLEKIVYGLLIFGIATSVSNASVYLNEKSAQEGLERGKTEIFASSTGLFMVHYKDNTDQMYNGIYIHPSLVLTTRHTLKVESCEIGIFLTHPDADKFSSIIKNKETSNSQKEQLTEIYAPINLSKIYLHPDKDVDLAIVGLNYPLTGVTPLPLSLTKPKGWPNGYLVSYGSVYTSPSSTKLFAKNKRHISILDVEERFLDMKSDYGQIYKQPYLVKDWDLKGNLEDKYNYNFIPKEGMHRLNAFTQPRDSGAGFIIKCDGKHYLAGIHKGRMLFPKTDGNQKVSSGIIPLYPYKDWIEGILKGVDK